ncbi:zinc finger CCCH domain-containing protein 30-like [Vicia villosa]|uniref:zinc finger CCCH domain-containing protein 30-like n=1 Tax=Vicia villosa TaxID=3911 RepID=UPI00273CD9F4|nr:zinc finger CCCH domain-containing protein 30-like [Vicia villosa]
MKTLTVNTEDSFSSLLEFASNNDIEGFKQLLDKEGASSINEVGIWYGRQNGSNKIVMDYKTPLMVAATYGSIDVMKLILSYPEADVDFACGVNKSTALHCAASGGSVNVVEAVRVLVSAGADVSCVDANGNLPVDVFVVPPMMESVKAVLEELLLDNGSENGSVGEFSGPVSVDGSSLGSLENGMPLPMPYSPSVSPPSPVADLKFTEKKEYLVDPSIPDIKDSIYASDEFRMFSFKVRPCSRAYSHDWTECPFVHPGENARRRDPRKFHYSCVPCPEFRKGTCRRGDMCEYAHGVFECWLHPAQYRTRLCKDGTSCNRRVCFFAHIAEELRPLYPSTGSAVASPRSSGSALNVMDMAAAMSLLPGSPSSVSSMSPHFAQPMSPSGNGISWAPQNVPALHLPGNILQSSRLRSSFSARDIPPEDFSVLSEFDRQQHLMNDLSCFSQPHPGSCRSKALTPSNLEELFSAETLSSPRYSDASMPSVFSPSHKSAAMNQFKQLQNMLSPINTNMLSPKNVEHPLLQASFGVPSSGRMSPRKVEPISPMSPRMSAFAHREKQQLRSNSSRDLGPISVEPMSPMSPRMSAYVHHEKQQQQLRSISSRDLGSNIPALVTGSPTWSKWGSPNGLADWSVKGEGISCQMRSASSFEHKINAEQEPDLSWVQSLVKDSSPEMIKEKVVFSGPIASGDELNSNSQIESIDHSVLGAWLEQKKLDQLVV